VILSAALALAGYLAFGPVPASGGPDRRPPPGMLHATEPGEAAYLPRWDRMSVSLEVLVRGRPLPTFRYAGSLYLPVPRLGDAYEIRIRNSGLRRIAALVSVDGLSVLSGLPASAAEPGYLVDPGGSIRIKGWRRDRNTVAAFYFTGREESYAAGLGRPENVGVIRLLAIEEQAPLRPRPWLEKEDAARAAMMHREAGDTGTGYGRDLDSPVYEVPFARSGNTRTIVLYYDTVEGLRRQGVPVDEPFSEPIPDYRETTPLRPWTRNR
jgi:hypothetical protein